MNRETILNNLITIATTTGKEVLNIYNSRKELNIFRKEDKSPQIEADLVSHHTICDELKRLNLAFPILSEESAKIEASERLSWDRYWLIDPLDGTKEFINRTGQFTINIALVENHKPVLGVVYVPVEDICYYAGEKIGAFKREKKQKEIAISVGEPSANNIVVVVSHDEKNPLLNTLLQGIGPHTLIQIGSSMKICYVAEGKADLYARLFPTSEWDTAAAHCILSAAGGDLYDVTNKTSLEYNTKPSLRNPPFLAMSKANKAWLNLI